MKYLQMVASNNPLSTDSARKETKGRGPVSFAWFVFDKKITNFKFQKWQNFTE